MDTYMYINVMDTMGQCTYLYPNKHVLSYSSPLPEKLQLQTRLQMRVGMLATLRKNDAATPWWWVNVSSPLSYTLVHKGSQCQKVTYIGCTKAKIEWGAADNRKIKGGASGIAKTLKQVALYCLIWVYECYVDKPRGRLLVGSDCYDQSAMPCSSPLSSSLCFSFIRKTTIQCEYGDLIVEASAKWPN
jgi:hypothetical protein